MKFKFNYSKGPKMSAQDAKNYSHGNYECRLLLQTMKGSRWQSSRTPITMCGRYSTASVPCSSELTMRQCSSAVSVSAILPANASPNTEARLWSISDITLYSIAIPTELKRCRCFSAPTKTPSVKAIRCTLWSAYPTPTGLWPPMPIRLKRLLPTKSIVPPADRL